MKIIKSAAILTSVLGSLLAPLSAFAIPYNGATVYKVTADGIDQVIFSSTPNTRVAVSIENQERNSARIAGNCGEVQISSSTNDYEGLKVDDVAVDASALSVQTLPSCVNGVFAEARTTNFKTPTGKVIIVGKTPSAAVKVMLPTDVIRYVTINGCGFGALKVTTSNPTLPGSFKVGTDSYTTSSLPVAPDAPICRTSKGVATGYTPASW